MASTSASPAHVPVFDVIGNIVPDLLHAFGILNQSEYGSGRSQSEAGFPLTRGQQNSPGHK
jgi:hypothetical protein